MGLRRRELALSSAVRRTRGPAGAPGTAPAAATMSTLVEGPIVDEPFITTGKSNIRIVAVASGANGGAANGGGGGSCAVKTLVAPPSTIYLTAPDSGDTTVAGDVGGASVIFSASPGTGTFGGLASNCIGADAAYNGGNGGTGTGSGGLAGTDGADGAAGVNGAGDGSDGVARGDGGSAPFGLHHVGGFTITWNQ